MRTPLLSRGGELYPAVARGGMGIVVLMLCASILFIGMSCWPAVFDETEGQYAGAAHEMLESGTWLVPTNNGIPRLQKPPLVYWFIRSSMTVFGQNHFAARLPNALATIGWIFATYLLAVRVGGPQLGLFAAAIFSSLLGLFIFSHLIEPEPFLALFVSMVFWCFLSAWHDSGRARRWFIWAWVFMALGVMTKGLHGALIPLAVAGLTALFNRGTRPFWRGLFAWPGLVLFAGIVVPWYAAISLRYPGFLYDHFINEQFGHLVNKRWPPDTEKVPLGIFWLQHVFYFWPWILFLPAAVYAWLPRNRARVDGTCAWMLWTWILLTLAGVLFSSRQDHYTMLTWGAVSIWLALPWTERAQLPAAWLRRPFAIFSATGFLAAIAACILAPRVFSSSVSVTPSFDHSDLYKSVIGTIGAWDHALWLIGGVGLIFCVGGLIGMKWVRAQKKYAAGLMLAGLMALPFGLVIRGYAMEENNFSLARIGNLLNQVAAKDSLVVCEGEPHQNASIFFYYDRHIHWIEARPDGDFVQRALGMGTELYLDQHQFTSAWHSSQTVYFILDRARLPFWQQALGLTSSQIHPLERGGTRILLRNG